MAHLWLPWKRPKRVLYCDVNAISHSCDILDTPPPTFPNLLIKAEHGPKDALWPTMVAGFKEHNPLFDHQVSFSQSYITLSKYDMMSYCMINTMPPKKSLKHAIKQVYD